MKTTNQRAELLGSLRDLKNAVQTAEKAGYNVADDTGRLHLLLRSKTGIPAKFQALWRLNSGGELPENESEILEASITQELFTSDKKTRR